jgi:hypothetical protein
MGHIPQPDLATLLRHRQDELRGRPLDWRDGARDRFRRMRNAQWLEILVLGSVGACALCIGWLAILLTIAMWVSGGHLR